MWFLVLCAVVGLVVISLMLYVIHKELQELSSVMQKFCSNADIYLLSITEGTGTMAREAMNSRERDLDKLGYLHDIDNNTKPVPLSEELVSTVKPTRRRKATSG